MKKQYINPVTETVKVHVESCLLNNSITDTSGLTHELQQGEGTSGADSRQGGGWDDDY